MNKSLEEEDYRRLPLGAFYPELADCALWCATEMPQRAQMDTVAEAFQA
jgi:hypothetical protein